MATFFKPPRFLMRERGSARTHIPESRKVTCYRCAKESTVSGFAESSSCPHCGGNLRLLPINIIKGHWGSSLLTTESVEIHEQAKAIANIIVASHNITIAGEAHAMCICGGTATITSTGHLKGGIRANKLIIEPGAHIEGSIAEAPSVALGTIDIDAASRARPGTGPAAQIEFKPHASSNPEPKESAPKNQQPRLVFPNASHQPQLRVVR